MKSLVCPISDEIANKAAVRLTGFLVALTLIAYTLTAQPLLMVVIAVDFFIRAYTSLKYSLFSGIALLIVRMLRIKPTPIDKAPKIFAARLGLVFSLSILALHLPAFGAARILAWILTGFALLESVCSFCVGCLIYTYLVLPLYSRK